MKLRTVFTILVTLIVALVTSASVALGSGFSQEGQPTQPENQHTVYLPLVITGGIDTAWSTFTNSTYNFSLEYPTGWRTEADGGPTENPLIANYQINIWSPIGEQIVIQIWDNNQEKLSLMEWYEARETTHLIVENAPTGPNARIAGEDAIMVARPKVVGVPAEVITLLSHEGKIFLLRYSATTESVESLPKYLHLLQTFEFNNKNTEDVLVPVKESELM